ncbi:MAG: hypothetical protein AABX11_05490 [Nanoarchaeota archaeon]
MILRHLTPQDSGQVFDAFCSASVMEPQGRTQEYGFYEYHLEQEDIRNRLELSEHGHLSVGLFGNRKDLLAYTIAYNFHVGRQIKDEVLQNVNVPETAIYCDQVFLNPRLPAFLAGRLTDYLTQSAQQLGVPGIFCAIPQSPWKNVSSTRFALHRGFKRRGFVSTEKTNLGIFTKPLWATGRVQEDLDIEIAGMGGLRQ